MKPKLKSGMLIQFHNKEVYMVINDHAINKDGWLNAEYECSYNRDYTIIAVSDVLITSDLQARHWTEETLQKHLLWKPEEEEEKMITVGDKKYSESTIKEALKEYVQD